MFAERIKSLVENHRFNKCAARFNLVGENYLEDTKTGEKFFRVGQKNWVVSIGGDDPKVTFDCFLDRVYSKKIS